MADGTAREFSERKAKTYLKLNCSLSPDFSVQLNVSLSERLSSWLNEKVKSPSDGNKRPTNADKDHYKEQGCKLWYKTKIKSKTNASKAQNYYSVQHQSST